MKFSDIQGLRYITLDNINIAKGAGWIWLKEPTLERTADIITDKTFAVGEGKSKKEYAGQIEFRIPLEPTTENIQKAYDALVPIFNNPKIKSPKLAKIVDIEELQEKKFADWNPEVGEVRKHDQRGKELCFFITWDKNKNKEPSLSSEEYKTFMLTALKALIDAGVEGIGYYPSQSVDKGLSYQGAGLPQIFTYLDYTMTDYTVFKHQDEYKKAGFIDPIENIQITLEDYLQAGITLSDLAKIRQNQLRYIDQHLPQVKSTSLKELALAVTYKNSDIEDLWLNRVEKALDKLKLSQDLKTDLKEVHTLLSERSDGDLYFEKLMFVKYLMGKENLSVGNLSPSDSENYQNLLNFAYSIKENIPKNVEQISSLFPQETDRENLIKLGYDNPTKLQVFANTAKHLSYERQLQQELGVQGDRVRDMWDANIRNAEKSRTISDLRTKQFKFLCEYARIHPEISGDIKKASRFFDAAWNNTVGVDERMMPKGVQNVIRRKIKAEFFNDEKTYSPSIWERIVAFFTRETAEQKEMKSKLTNKMFTEKIARIKDPQALAGEEFVDQSLYNVSQAAPVAYAVGNNFRKLGVDNQYKKPEGKQSVLDAARVDLKKGSDKSKVMIASVADGYGHGIDERQDRQIQEMANAGCKLANNELASKIEGYWKQNHPLKANGTGFHLSYMQVPRKVPKLKRSIRRLS